MSINLNQIQHHQRILITGKRGSEIFTHCKKVMDFYKRDYDVISDGSESVSEGPVVFIVSDQNLTEFEPHIALLDQVAPEEKAELEQLADSIPKSGTIVYNESDKLAFGIGSKERTDVHRESYKNDTTAAAKSLLKRIGINEARFDQAQ